MTRFLVSFAVLAVVVIFQGLSHGQEESGKNQTKKSQKSAGSSFLRAMAINAANVQSLDVLVLEENTHDISANEIKHGRVLTRLMIDFSNEKFLIVQFGDSSRVSDGKESKQSIRFVARYSDMELCESQFKRVGRSKMSFKQALYQLPGIIDFRYVGFRQFPTNFSRHLDFETFLSATEQLDLKCTEHTLGNNSQAVSLQRKFLKSEDVMMQNWVFDREKLIALSYSDSILRVENGVREVYPLTRETIDWEEHAGIFVPKKVKAVRLGQTQLEDGGKVLSYEIDIDAAFHWFSVNEPLGDDKVSDDYLSDVSKALTLVDPKLSGAKSLVE